MLGDVAVEMQDDDIERVLVKLLRLADGRLSLILFWVLASASHGIALSTTLSSGLFLRLRCSIGTYWKACVMCLAHHLECPLRRRCMAAPPPGLVRGSTLFWTARRVLAECHNNA